MNDCGFDYTAEFLEGFDACGKNMAFETFCPNPYREYTEEWKEYRLGWHICKSFMYNEGGRDLLPFFRKYTPDLNWVKFHFDQLLKMIEAHVRTGGTRRQFYEAFEGSIKAMMKRHL